MRALGPGVFPLLLVQFVSNTGTSTNAFVAIWLLSDPSIPTYFLGLHQGVFLATLMVGTRINPAVVRQLGLRRTNVWFLVTEGCGLAALGVWLVITAMNGADTTAAVGIIALAGLVTLASGINGPSWVSLLARWGDDDKRSSQRILADSSAFQFAAAIGPLLGAALLLRSSALWLLPVLNLLSNFALAGMVFRGIKRYPIRTTDPALSTRTTTRKTPLFQSLGALPIILLLVLAGFADPMRATLPIMVRESGGDAGVLALTATAFAIAAAAASFLGSEHPVARHLEGFMHRGGTFFSLGGGVLFWMLLPIPVGFVLGALMVGLGTSALYGQVMVRASEADQAQGSETRHVADAILFRALISSLLALLVTSLWSSAVQNIMIVGALLVIVYGILRVTLPEKRR